MRCPNVADLPTAFPLAWPPGKTRTLDYRRVRGATFTNQADGPSGTYRVQKALTIAGGLQRLQDALRRLGARNIVISTNLALRRDGLPYSSQAKLQADPGVAVYFNLDKDPVAIAADKFAELPQNMAAIAAYIDALRATERHGVGTLRDVFRGHMALPSEAMAVGPSWRDVLGNPTTLDGANSAYRDLSKEAGRIDERTEAEERQRILNTAIAQARAALK